jgi:hypothetical protein
MVVSDLKIHDPTPQTIETLFARTMRAMDYDGIETLTVSEVGQDFRITITYRNEGACFYGQRQGTQNVFGKD